jgi:hypothetical protein
VIRQSHRAALRRLDREYSLLQRAVRWNEFSGPAKRREMWRKLDFVGVRRYHLRMWMKGYE